MRLVWVVEDGGQVDRSELPKVSSATKVHASPRTSLSFCAHSPSILLPSVVPNVVLGGCKDLDTNRGKLINEDPSKAFVFQEKRAHVSIIASLLRVDIAAGDVPKK